MYKGHGDRIKQPRRSRRRCARALKKAFALLDVSGRGQLTQQVVKDVIKELGHYRGTSTRSLRFHSAGGAWGGGSPDERDDADARLMFAILDRSGDGFIDEVLRRPTAALEPLASLAFGVVS